ncbi:hypothetical protein SASPL_119529 [Salvia splendens]|uniref:Longin domain-containing protein n=1 Tax=Salvia splendens TaxID=180675 RepID=A0A8X8XN06_SALSN|nr:hypothetical protein SASPL_119529 [Salvia splendens]
MVPKGLIYSFVAKGTVVLAEHTPYSGNFSTIAVQCLQKLPSNSSKYTYSCDGHTFNFLLDSGFVFLVVADESMGRSIPFVFLERVKDDFKQRYGASFKSDDPHPLEDDEDEDDLLFEDRFSIAYNLDREFGPKLKEHMQYCMNHPEEMNKLSKVKAQITEVKGIMMDNIEKPEALGSHEEISNAAGFNLLSGTSDLIKSVLDRGEKIELLVDKTDNLQFQLPKARQAVASANVDAKSPHEADDCRGGSRSSLPSLAYVSLRFDKLAQQQHEYVSLEDVLRDDSIPKLESTEPNVVESQMEALLSKNSRNSKFPSSPSCFLLDACSEAMKEKKGLGDRLSCLKHSRSDDLLIYAERREEDDDEDELEILSQEMKNFSWKERIIKSALFSESEEDK